MPVAISDELAKEVEPKAGTVKYIVAPNKTHHLFLKAWAERYTHAMLYAPPEMEEQKVAKGV